MAADRVSLTEGYEGSFQGNRNMANEADSVQGLSKKQHSHTGDYLSQNKGALATQAGNGSTATANSLDAGAAMHMNNAAGGTEYLRRTAQNEESGAHTQAGDSNVVEASASDIAGKINRV